MSIETNTRVRYVSNGRYGIATGKTKSSDYGEEYEIDFLDGNPIYLPKVLLEEVPKVVTVKNLLERRSFSLNGIEDFRRVLSHRRLEGGLTNIFYSMNNSNTEFMAHQFKPVIKFLESTKGRLLIADEVGLGKTIEAIYIIKELQTRENAKRFLIICPKALCQKWKGDLQKRFDLSSSVVNTGKELAEKLKELVSKDFILICSLQSIRSRDTTSHTNAGFLNKYLQESAENGQDLFDLVIIDEAHNLRNSETASFKTAERFREVAKHLILLSATPIQTSSENLYNLLRLLAPEEFYNKHIFEQLLNDNKKYICMANAFRIGNTKEEILKIYCEQSNADAETSKILENILNEIQITTEYRMKKFNELKERAFYSQFFTRSRKNEVFINRPERDPKTYTYSFNEQEKQIYTKVTNYLKGLGKNAKNATIFALINRQRQLTSCMPAALEYFNKNESAQDIIDSIYDDLGDDEIIDDEINLELQYNIDADFLKEIRKNDSKFNELKKLIEKLLKENPEKKIIIFSFYRGTIDYLQERFEEYGIGSVKIKGGDENKEETVKIFKEDYLVNILITTEVLAEGVDLQFADTEINYDLPWNPMRLEQRIGRIDRIGQNSKKIYILNFSCKDTVEDRVLKKIYERMDIFKTSIGEIDDIIGKEILNLSKEIFNSSLDEQAELEKRMEETSFLKELDKQKLEEKASLVHEFGDFIIENINQAEENKRYIMPGELINYAQDFFSRFDNYYGTRMELVQNKPDSRKISFSPEAQRDLTDFMRRERLNMSQNVSRPNQQECIFGKSHIDINHALIRWMIDKNSRDKMVQSKCSAIYVEQPMNGLVGTFVYYIDFWSCEGFKNKKELRFYLCDLQGQLIEKAEAVLITALDCGKSIQNVDFKFDDNDTQQFVKSLEKCIERAKMEFETFKLECRQDNDSICERQIKFLTAYHNMKVKEHEQAIETTLRNNPKANVAGFKAMIEKSKNEKEEKLKDIEHKKQSLILNNSESQGGVCGGVLQIGVI